jgi:O-antigen/teichoic acid export membrane protein
MSSTQNNSLIQNGLYNLAGGAIKIVSGVVAIPIVIRFLGIEEYGLWALASSFISIFSLLEVSFSTAVTVFVSQDIEKVDNSSLSETITLSLLGIVVLASVASGGLYLGSPIVVNFYPNLNSEQSLTLLHGLQIGGITIWCRLFQQVLVGIEQAYQRYDLTNLANTGLAVCNSLSMIAVVVLGGKTLQIMEYQAIIGFVFVLIHCWMVGRLIRGIRMSWRWTISKALNLCRYSLMMWVTTIGGVLFSRVDRLVIGFVLDSKSLGVYSAITDVASQINGLSGIVIQPLLASLSTQILPCLPGVQKQVKKSLAINLYTSLISGLFVTLFAPFILMILLKESSVDTSYLLSFRLAILIYSLCSVNFVGYYVLLGMDRVGLCSIISLTSGFTSLILTYLGAVHWGLVGAIAGNTGILIVYTFTFIAMRIVGIPFDYHIKNSIAPIFCLLLISLVLSLSKLSIEAEVLISFACFSAISGIIKNSFDNLKSSF